MAEVLVLGAGMNGLSAAMLLAGDGHRVTVLERDAAAPEDAGGGAEALWEGWERRGVNQFRQIHLMLPRWRALMAAELPRVLDRLEALGGVRVNLLGVLPDALTGGLRDGDERFETLTARRPVLEAALSAAAEATPGVTVRRGAAVTGLVAGTPAIAGVPHVTGVLTAGGEVVRADLVVDAGGRRSPVIGMLDGIGCRRPIEEREDSGFVYYARHYRSRDGRYPEALVPLLQPYESLSVLTLQCDAGTWGIALVTAAGDKRLRALRDAGAWEAALARYPAAAHWAGGEAITGVQVIAATEDRWRRFVVDGQPVVTGLVAIGDAWACTNPSLGRGSTIGLLHAQVLRDLLREVGPDQPEKLAHRFDETTEATVGQLYRMTLGYDRHRLAEIAGDVSGQPYRTGDPNWTVSKALYAAALRDPEALRAYLSVMSLRSTAKQVLVDAGLLDKVIALGADAPSYPNPGATRAELLAAVEAAAGGPAATPTHTVTRHPARAEA